MASIMKKSNALVVGAGLIALALSSLVSSGPRVAWALQAVLANDVFKVNHFITAVGDNTVRIWNPTSRPVVVAGTSSSSSTAGMLCAMIYVYDSHEEQQECCGCPVTNNGLRQIGTFASLTSNPLGGPQFFTGIIKIVSTDPNVACPQATGPGQACPNPPPFFPCNPALGTAATSPPGPTVLDPTLRAAINHSDQVLTNGGTTLLAGFTEEEFLDAPLDAPELSALVNNCAAIHTGGTGHGICDCGTGDTLAARPAAGLP